MEKFNFFLPTSIKKGKDKEDNDVYEFEGLASNSSKDSDGESLPPDIFDFSEFKYVNWNHESGPDAIIGEKTEHWLDKGNIMVRGIIYSSLPKGKATVELMKALERSPNGYKLGISIEGQVLQRDLVTKQPIKAKINSIALCPFPKNGTTWAELIKKAKTGEEIYQAPEILVYEQEDSDDTFSFLDKDGNILVITEEGDILLNKSQLTPNSSALIQEDVEREEVKKAFVVLSKGILSGELNLTTQELISQVKLKLSK